jgi:hypothetical protein
MDQSSQPILGEQIGIWELNPNQAGHFGEW